MTADQVRQRLAVAGIAGALSLIATFEGTFYAAYLDPVRIPTICRGHTAGVQPGQIATPQQCDDYTVQDLLKAKATMDSCLRMPANSPLNDNQRAAFTSFVFNVGHGMAGVNDGFCVLKNGRPSTMLTLLNSGNISAACNQLPLWNTANGKVYPGLTKRRAAERELCLKAPT